MKNKRYILATLLFVLVITSPSPSGHKHSKELHDPPQQTKWRASSFDKWQKNMLTLISYFLDIRENGEPNTRTAKIFYSNISDSEITLETLRYVNFQAK